MQDPGVFSDGRRRAAALLVGGWALAQLPDHGHGGMRGMIRNSLFPRQISQLRKNNSLFH